MSTVTGRYTDAQGNPVSGTVYISPAARAGVGQPPDIVVEKRVWADLDEQGRISITVIPSDDPGWLIDGQMPYLVEERLSGLPFRAYWIGVPDAGVDLSAVQHVDPDVAPMPVPGPQGPQGIQGPEGPQGPPGEDFTPTDADARYVNIDGDTMTGSLDIAPSGPVNVRARPGGTNWGQLGVYPQPGGEAKIMAKDGDDNAYLSTTKSQWYANAPMRVPFPTAAQHVPRLARTPTATGDLGLPGYAGSDTGWRDITASLANSWTTETTYNVLCRVARRGTRVIFRARLLPPATNAVPWLASAGFVPDFQIAQIAGVFAGASAVASADPVPAYTSNSSKGIRAASSWNTYGSIVHFDCSWETADPWPTSLPGTAITQPATWT